MRNKNLLVLIIVILAVAVVAALAIFLPKTTPELPAVVTPATTSNPEAVPGAEPTAEPFPSAGYVYVTAGAEGRWFELPKEGDPVSFTIRLTREDGTETENKVTMTTDSVFMAHSTCDNQDCVQQGVVSLENKSERVLLNLIVCLPNQVSVELFDQAEMYEMLAQAEAAAATEAQ